MGCRDMKLLCELYSPYIAAGFQQAPIVINVSVSIKRYFLHN